MAGAVFLLPLGGATAYGAVSSYAGVRTYAVVSAAYDTPSASPTAPDRAGSRAGEGRMRPGRTALEDASDGADAEDVEGATDASAGQDDEDLVPSAEPPDEAGLLPSEAPGTGSTEEQQPVGHVLRILPLGSGLVLIGLGLGLAFLALRLRRV